MSNIVVLHSGGQDSTTCLAWAMNTWRRELIYPVLFNYNQRHAVEMEQALKITELLEIPNRTQILPVEALDLLGGAALTDRDVEVHLDATRTTNTYAAKRGLPSTFVPGRNLLFLTLAAAYGAKVDADTIVTGVCQTDRAGYPDCRAEFIDDAERAISSALDQTTHIIAPLLRRTKAETWELAERLHVLDLVIEETHTCYHGVHDLGHRWEWGYGCNDCPACDERRSGYEEFRSRQFASRLP